jgi:trehalose/maltose hydrolase-like predicted phosphorylase
VYTESALRFPWESGFSGVELQRDADGLIGSYGGNEQHISADIALAAKQYYYATGDTGWLQHVGFWLIKGIAEFYASRVQKTGKWSWGILNVMGPDEFVVQTNNSAFTNAAAAMVLETAVELAMSMNETVPSEDWLHMARGLRPHEKQLPSGSGGDGLYHPEYEGYPWRHKDYQPNVKQADTVLLQFPLEYPMDRKVAANDLRWYEAHTSVNGPAMTWAMFAISWMRLGDEKKAQRLFQRAYSNYVVEPFNVWTETHEGGGCVPFITGAGGWIQSIVHGVIGMRILSDRLSFNPVSPRVAGANVTAVSLPAFNWRNARLRIRVTEHYVEVGLIMSAFRGLKLANATDHRLGKKPDDNMRLEVGGRPILIPRGSGEHSIMEWW